jgi:hypothetical protein
VTSAVVAALVVLWQFVMRGYSEWETVYVETARTFLAGGDIYVQGHGYSYPPFAALLAAPFTFLPHYAVRAVWYVVNLIAVIGLVGWGWRLAGGAAWTCLFHDRREWLAALLGLACSERYISNALSHQQVDVLVASLIMAGCALLMRQRPGAAGAAIGVAAAFKATPMLFAPYFAWRREWITAASVIAVAVGLNLAPDLVHAPWEGGSWLEQWLSRFVFATLGDPNRYPGTWLAAPGDNQSLAGTVGRLLTTTLNWSTSGVTEAVRDPLLGPRAARALVYSALAALFAVSLSAIGPSRRLDWNVEPSVDVTIRPVFEVGMILCLMLLASPMSSRAHFATLILPAFSLARFAMRRRDSTVWAAFLVAAAAGIANRDVLGRDLSDIALWCGVPTAGTVALWIGCIIVLGRRSKADSAHIEA